MLAKILYGILFFGVGVAILKYRRIVYEWTGRWGWAEKYLGSGGTITALTLLALGLIAISIAYPLGAFDSLKWDGNGRIEVASPIH